MIRINLLGEEQDRSSAYTVQILAFSASLVLSVLGCFFFHDTMSNRLEIKKTEREMLTVQRDKLREKTKKVESFEADKKLLREKLTTIASLKAKKHGPVHVLNDVTVAIPERAWLLAMTQKQDVLQFQGLALDPQTVSLFMRNLERSPYFGNVDLVDSKREVKEEVPLQKFMVAAKLRDPLKAATTQAGKPAAGAAESGKRARLAAPRPKDDLGAEP